MLQFSRRAILKIFITATFVLTLAKETLAALIKVLPQEEQKQPLENPTLRALIETLIPADETPSALETGVLEKIINKAHANPKYETMLLNGCRSFGGNVGSHFWHPHWNHSEKTQSINQKAPCFLTGFSLHAIAKKPSCMRFLHPTNKKRKTGNAKLYKSALYTNIRDNLSGIS